MYFLCSSSSSLHSWVLAVSFVYTLSPFVFQANCFLTFFLFYTSSFSPPLLIWPLSLFGVRRSAHYSLPHVRINVLHLPAHTQIRLHRHQTQPSLGSISLWLWLWGWGRVWRAAGAGPASPGPHLRSARWGWTCRWPCMEVQTRDGDKNTVISRVFMKLWRKKKASTLVQPWKCQLIPLLCWLCPCCALISFNIH